MEPYDSLIGRAFKRGQYNYGKEAQEEQVYLVQGLVPFNRVVNHLPYQKYMKAEQRHREALHPRGYVIDQFIDKQSLDHVEAEYFYDSGYNNMG